MNYWLIKSEPLAYSWTQMVRDGKTGWSGVRNHQAANNLKAMKRGDQAFFYHSNDGKQIMGTVEIVKEAYPDPSDEAGKFVMVDVKTGKPFQRPVTLAEIKENPDLQAMAFVRQSRLSVSPVTAKEWLAITKIGRV